MKTNVYLSWLLFVVNVFFSSTISAAGSSDYIGEFRIKVGDILERLRYPSKVSNINEMGEESYIRLALDFTSGMKPNLLQFALVPKSSRGQHSTLLFDMEFKESDSKAILNIDLRKLKPNSVALNLEYDMKMHMAASGTDPINWELGTLRMPHLVRYIIADVEDHFHQQPEIYSPVKESDDSKTSPIYPVIGLVAVLFPWAIFFKLWTKSSNTMIPASFLFDTSKSMYFPLFTASLLSLFGLIVCSWLFLNIFQTLALLTFLAIFSAVFGFKAFRAAVQGNVRTKSEKSD